MFAMGWCFSAVNGATINCPTCSQDDFEHAYYVQSQPGDTIVLPAGAATWGNSSRANSGIIFIITNVTVVGQGDSTVITLDDTGATFGNGVIALWGAATFKHFKIVGSGVNPVTAFNVSSFNNTTTGINFTDGFRISDITYVGGGGPNSQGYFAFIAAGVLSGLIDNCRITGNNGGAELIYGRGPTNAWQSPNTLGGASNIFIEDCTFNNTAYVCDANSNARFVVRFCTINGQNKIDGHGLASNNPARSVRNIEVYDNTWTATGAGNWTNIEIRGGTFMAFDNSSTVGWAFLTDYGYQAQWPNYGSILQTPFNYPLGDQVGTGQDVTVNATAITAGEMVRIASLGSTDFTAIGASANTVGTQFIATGAGTGTGTATHAPASEPGYFFHNLQNGLAWPRNFWTPQVLSMTTKATGFPIGTTNVGVNPIGTTINGGNALAFAGDPNRYTLAVTEFATSQNFNHVSPGLLVAIPAVSTAVTAGAVTNYQKQTGNPAATFIESDIIKSNRDFFADAGFDTNTGVSRGTTAQMNALTPSVVGYGFWVTDQGSWRSGFPSSSGQLYTWTGSSWVLKYTPYTYPHPLRTPRAPTNLQLGP